MFQDYGYGDTGNIRHHSFELHDAIQNSPKMNGFFHLSVGVAKILSMALSDHYNSLLWTNFLDL